MKTRLFLALPAILDDYELLQQAFDRVITGRWIPSENLHLTLNFFGDRFEQALLKQHLSTLSLHLPPLTLRGVGYFAKNRILYARVEEQGLADIYRSVNMLLGMPVKETFVPHVTLMRVKQIIDEEAFHARLERYATVKLGMLGEETVLMQSELHSDGARYSVVERF